MSLTGKIYALAKQKEDLDSKKIFESMIQESINDDVVVIDGRNIAAGSVYASQIHADAITAEHIRSDSITSDHIEAGSIDADRLNASQVILPGDVYGGVVINNDGLSMKSTGIAKLDIKLSSASGFNITDRFNNQLIDINPSTGNVKMQVNEMTIGGYSAATQDDIDNIEVGGRNLLVQHTITERGYLTSTGAFFSNAAWFHTDYIPVAGYTKLITSGYTNLGSSPAVVYYDADFAFVKGVANGGISRAKEMTIEPGISYIRFSGEIKDLPTLKIEKGNKATDWTPAPEDIEDSYRAVAEAKANLAETQAKAYADGEITKEEERAIQDAENKLAEAKTHADGKAETAETNAKDYAKEQVDGIEIGGRNLLSYNYGNYVISTYAYIELSDKEEPFILKLYEKDSEVDMSGIYFGFTKGGLNGTGGTRWAYSNGSLTSIVNDKLELTTKEHRFFSFYPSSERAWNKILERYDLKLEKGNKATDWTEAPEDADAKINERPTFDDFVKTDKVTIDGGNITADSLHAGSIKSNTITANQIASKTITTEELNVTSLSAITANLGTVTAGTIRSSDNAIDIDLDKGTINLSRPLTINHLPISTKKEVEDAVQNIETSERNLIYDSGKLVSVGEIDQFGIFDLLEPIEEGSDVTLVYEATFDNPETYTEASLYWQNNNGDTLAIVDADINHLGWDKPYIYKVTFKWENWEDGYGDAYHEQQLVTQLYDTTGVNNAHITWIKLVKGNKTSSSWLPAPEDTQVKIDEKTDTKVTDKLQEQLGDFVTIEENNKELGDITTALNDYLSEIKQTRDSVHGLLDEDGNYILDDEGNPIQGGIVKELETLLDRAVGIENNLGEFTETWNFEVSEITMGEEGLFVGNELSDMGILIAPDRIVDGETIPAGIYFVDGGKTIAFISGQMMQINRGIFVQSATIGEHKIETITGGHTIWNWIPS